MRRTIAIEWANSGDRTRCSPSILGITASAISYRTRVTAAGDGDQFRVEVIERRCNDFRADGSHRRRPAREVLHALVLEAELAETFTGLGREVDRRVQPVEGAAQLPGTVMPLRTRVTARARLAKHIFTGVKIVTGATHEL